MPLRIAYLSSYIIPALIDKKWTVAAISIPWILKQYGGGTGASGGVLPAYFELYMAFGLILTLANCKPNLKKIPASIFILLIWTIIVNLFFDPEGYFSTFTESCVMLMIVFLAYDNDSESLSKLSFLWACASLAIGITFIFLRGNFDAYSREFTELGETRSGWMDPNYFGTVLGMGAVTAMIELKRNKGLTSFLRLLYVAAVAITVVAAFYNASRGSLAGLAVVGVVFMIFSKTRLFYKVIISCGAVYFLYLLYNNDVMDVFLYRIQNDNATGSRVGIWADKANDFFTNYTPLAWLFGVGNSGVVTLGGRDSNYVSAHNDFLSVLFQYGFIGFAFYMSMIFRPFYRVIRIKAVTFFPLVALSYLVTVLFALNPITGGQFPYFLFVFYVYALSYESIKEKYILANVI